MRLSPFKAGYMRQEQQEMISGGSNRKRSRYNFVFCNVCGATESAKEATENQEQDSLEMLTIL